MPFAAQHIRDARNHLRRSDPVMRDIIKRVGPFTAKTRRDRFASLAGAIIAQQISGKAATSIWNKLEALIEPEKISADSLDGMTIKQLGTAGVSRQKASYLQDLSARVLAGDVQLGQIGRKTDEDVIVELTQVKGIGRWTAQMFLMFTLGRLDVLPVDDLGVKSALVQAYGLNQLPESEVIEKLAEPWRPYASIACWYLWRSLETD